VVPTKSQGCALFIGNEEKVFIIYVDNNMGAAINMFMQKTPKQRPLTHDLIGHILKSLDARIERVVINDLNEGTYFARLILRMDNEIQHKLVEIDARPSDCLALALQDAAPVYVSTKVWAEAEDMSEVLDNLASQAHDLSEEQGDEDELH